MSWNDPRIDPGQIGGAQPAWGEMYPRRQTTLGDERGYGDWVPDAKDNLSALAGLIAPNLMEGRRAPLESAMLDVGNWVQFPEAGALKAGAAALPLTAGIVLDAGKQVRKLADNIPYRNILSKFLDDPNVVIPYIPKSYAEPVVAKSATKNIAPVAEAMGWPQYGKAKGFRTSLPEGSMLATTIERQKTTGPHEFGHEVQRAWQNEPVFGEALTKETLDMFNALHPEIREGYLARWGKWPTYNNAGKFANELTADFVNPETFAQRFPDTISNLSKTNQGLFTDIPAMNENYGWGHLKEELANRYPTVGAFWDEVPGRIPKNIYDLPEGWK